MGLIGAVEIIGTEVFEGPIHDALVGWRGGVLVAVAAYAGDGIPNTGVAGVGRV